MIPAAHVVRSRPLLATTRASTYSARKKSTVLDMRQQYHRGVPIVLLTAYDYCSAALVDQSESVDAVLVGDSLGMCQLGYDSTIPVTMDEMILHCKSVARGCKKQMLIGDMPFGSYEGGKEDALRNALRFLKEGDMDAVKLEGGRRVAQQVKAIVTAGIPVMGHIGLTPQSLNALGGFRVQGKTAEAAKALIEDARALERAGAFSIVIEGVPDRVADLITRSVNVPTIGIGAGNQTSGQVLVWQDMFGLFPRMKPKFCKRYKDLGAEIQEALAQYKRDVTSRTFPGKEHSYLMTEEEWNKLSESLDVQAIKSKEQKARSDQPAQLPAAELPKEPVVVIVGGGAMGSLFAATLASEAENATYKPQIWMLDGWREHVDAINKDGLEIESPDGKKKVLKNVRAATDVAEILEKTKGRCDVAFIAVKSWQTAEAAAKVKSLLNNGPGVAVTLQNGLGNAEKIGEFVGKERVLQGTISHGAEVSSPGHVRHTGYGDLAIAAQKDSPVRGITEGLSQLFNEQGLKCSVVEDASHLLWKKVVVNASINPLTALTGMTNGELLRNPAGRKLVRDIALESAAVAAARGIQFPFDPEAAVVDVLTNTAKNRSSMLQDVMRGTPTEVDAISGAIAREGRLHGVPVPLNAAVSEALSSPSVLAELPKLQPVFRAFLRSDE